MVSLVRRAALAVFHLFFRCVSGPVCGYRFGLYLAGRQAIYESDYTAAEKYYARR